VRPVSAKNGFTVHDIRTTVFNKERQVTLASKSAARAGSSGSLARVRIRREEVRTSDQRREDRHLGVIGRAVIRYQRQAHDVPVLNVSAHGAMIRSDLEPQIGARIDIQFEECNWTQCHVRWVRGGRVGLEFEKETLIISANDSESRMVSGRRTGEHPTIAIKSERAPRQHLILRGQLHWRSGSMPVRLRNISGEGAMIDGTQDLDVGEPVVLELPGGVAVEAIVRWCQSRHIGVRFDRPFDPVALVQDHDETPAQVDYVKPDYLKSDGKADSPWAARWEKLSRDDL
jgi:hypothetical protein